MRSLLSLLARAGAFAVFVGLLGTPAAQATANPDFDSVTWTPLGCQAADPITHTSPNNFDFVGDATYPSAYFAHDGAYLYFRYRMDGDPAGSGGFAQGAWVALMQVPSGDPFQYQYELALNGKTDTIEIWQNTTAMDISFNPLFHDTPESKIFSQKYNLANGTTFNTTPLARRLPTGDGSNFDGTPDYFVDFAFPVSVMVANGLITSDADLDDAVFFPATSTDPNNYNKGHLNCPFLPLAHVTVSKSVDPTSLPANTTTPVTYTIVVGNDGPGIAKGIELTDPALPAFFSNVAVDVSSDDPSVTWMVVGENPLDLKIMTLPAGSTVTVHITADAHPTCSDPDYTNTASVDGVNSTETTGSALLSVAPGGAEICDGIDNDCNGVVDDGGNALCDDGNPCTTDVCNGAAGCSHDPIPGCVPCSEPSDCDDGNACTTETCVGGVCGHEPIEGCVPCSVPSDCDDGNACTTETCIGGVCGHEPVDGCVPCSTPSDCNDGNACTTETCNGGVCGHDPIPGCVPCASPADCNDNNACTTETCNGGVCGHDPIPGCTPCSTPSDCNDNNACTTETCNGGVCGHTPIAGCTPCSTPSDCNDNNACTTETCNGGVCGHTPIAGCTPCSTPSDCNDGNACTTETCNGGVCGHDPVPGCTPCSTPSDCNDNNACTTETCNGGVCGHTPIAGCTPCSTPSDCNDNNACTTETCIGGVCGHTPIAGCTPCSTPSDCNDNNACTSETCNGGVCGHDPIAGCTPCATPSDCDDHNACTTETCIGGMCGHDPIAGCTPCATPSDCDDHNACTTETCVGGVCGHMTPDPTCVPCTTAAQCDDHNGCTTDACTAGVCTHMTPDPTCVPCTTANDCNDHNGCTTDTCNASGVCQHTAPPGCIPCTTAAQCNDNNPCTNDACGEDGSCRITAIPGCQRCTTAADCDDHVECTIDTCAGGVCQHDRTPACELTCPEPVDCTNPNCANNPACQPKEICGNCIDDDGNGLVDGEDPACCGGNAAWMDIKRFMMKPGSASVVGSHIHGNRLRLRTRYKMATANLFDPSTEDTEIQVADEQGQIFCQVIPAKYWKHPHRRVFRFKDKTGAFAGGLKNGRFKMKRNGKIVFNTRGKKMDLRSTDGHNVKITVRVGNVCAQETKQLRSTRKKALVWP